MSPWNSKFTINSPALDSAGNGEDLAYANAMKRKASTRKASYHKFDVVDSLKPKAKARPKVDAASPPLTALQAKLGGKKLKKLAHTVTYKRAVPKTTAVDGSASSKRLLVERNRVIGAQG
jgi:hypothetical protein